MILKKISINFIILFVIILGLFLFLNNNSYANIDKKKIDFTDFLFYKESEKATKDGLYYIEVDNDIEKHSKKFLDDIRVYTDINWDTKNKKTENLVYKKNEENFKDKKNKIFNQVSISSFNKKEKKEVKYLKKQDQDYFWDEVKKIDLDFKTIGEQEYLLDLDNEIKKEYINSITLKTHSSDFKTEVEVFGADNPDNEFERLNIEPDQGDIVYSSLEGSDFNINFKYSNYRYLKLKFLAFSDDFKVDGFYKEKRRTFLAEGDKQVLKVFGVNKFIDENHQVILLNTKNEKRYFDSLILKFNNNEFDNREYELYGADTDQAEFLEDEGKYNPKKKYWIKLDSGILRKNEIDDYVVIKINNDKKFYRLLINNRDNENLDFDSARFEKYKIKLFFEAKKGQKFYIYYGNSKLEKPRYNLKFSDWELKNAKNISLKKEKKTKIYLKKINKNLKKYWWIYFIGFFFVTVAIFFVIKIMRENRNKTAKDEIKI